MQLLDTHLYEANIPHDLRHLIMYIARAAKYINYAIRTGDLGQAGSMNLFGEDQAALDVLADQIIENTLIDSHLVKAVMSEEKREMVMCKCAEPKCTGKYAVAYDPLDGSSLIDVNMAVGSVFSIYEGGGFVKKTGRDQVAALYTVYGPRTTLVYSVGKGVHEFTLNDVGEYSLTKKDIKLAEESKYFAPGNLRATEQNEGYKKLVESWMSDQYTLRYSGGMTPDLNHMLIKGNGIFTYPPLMPKYPNGKLRLLFECNPFSYLIEQAGGAASNGEKDVMDVEITDVHQTTPIYIGSKKEVKKAVDALK